MPPTAATAFPAPPGGARDGRRLLAVALAGFCAFLGLYVTQPMLPTLEQYFQVGKATVSLTLTASTLGVAIAAPVIGSVADRLGRKRVIVWSATLLTLATLLAACSAGLWSLVFWRFLQGLVTPGVFAVTMAYVQEEWVDGGGGRAMALYVTGTALGGFSGRMASGFIVSRWHWHWAFAGTGLLVGLTALALQAWLPRERRFSGRRAEPLLRGMLMHLGNPRLLAAFAVGFGVLFSLVATFTYVTFHLAGAPYRLGPAAMGLLFCTYLFGAAVTPPCGRIIDRRGPRAALFVAMGAGVAGMVLTLLPSLLLIVAGLALCCSAVFVAQAASTSFIGVAAERNKALAVGLYATCYYVGGSLGAELPGLLWRWGGWTTCVALVILVQLLIVLVAGLGWRTRGVAKK
jgi:predicted MFS family arabinose efflux permease